MEQPEQGICSNNAPQIYLLGWNVLPKCKPRLGLEVQHMSFHETHHEGSLKEQVPNMSKDTDVNSIDQ